MSLWEVISDLSLGGAVSGKEVAQQMSHRCQPRQMSVCKK